MHWTFIKPHESFESWTITRVRGHSSHLQTADNIIIRTLKNRLYSHRKCKYFRILCMLLPCSSSCVSLSLSWIDNVMGFRHVFVCKFVSIGYFVSSISGVISPGMSVIRGILGFLLLRDFCDGNFSEGHILRLSRRIKRFEQFICRHWLSSVLEIIRGIAALGRRSYHEVWGVLCVFCKIWVKMIRVRVGFGVSPDTCSSHASICGNLGNWPRLWGKILLETVWWKTALRL